MQHRRGILIILAVVILGVFLVGFWLRGRHLEVYEQEAADGGERVGPLWVPLTPPSPGAPAVPPAPAPPATPDTTTYPTP